MAEYTERTVQGPEGVTVTEVKAKKTSPVMTTLKKILPWVAIGAGLILIIMVVRSYVTSPAPGGSVAPAPLADSTYGTPTLSGIPAYDQYQAKYGPTDQARQLTDDPTSLGLTYQDSRPQVPRSIIQDGKNLYTSCDQKCNGMVGCTDSSAYNYDPNATCGCINCCVPRTYGCLDPKASTYNPFANTNDSRFCKYAVQPQEVKVAPAALDCVAQLQLNPDAAGCNAPLGGCNDPNNAMYNPQATYNDGSCVYGGKLVLPKAQENTSGCASLAAPLNTGCLAPQDTQLLGGIKGCGDAWDLRKGNSLGATTY